MITMTIEKLKEILKDAEEHFLKENATWGITFPVEFKEVSYTSGEMVYESLTITRG